MISFRTFASASTSLFATTCKREELKAGRMSHPHKFPPAMAPNPIPLMQKPCRVCTIDATLVNYSDFKCAVIAKLANSLVSSAPYVAHLWILHLFIKPINPRCFGSWCVKETEESTLEVVDSSVPLTHHDPRDVELIC